MRNDEPGYPAPGYEPETPRRGGNAGAAILGAAIGSVGIVLLLVATGVIAVAHRGPRQGSGDSTAAAADTTAPAAASAPAPFAYADTTAIDTSVAAPAGTVDTAATAPIPANTPSAYGAVTDTTAVSVDTAAAAPAPEDPAERLRPELQAAVLRADQLEVDATRSLSAGELANGYSGAMLQTERERIAGLRKQGLYADSHLDDIAWVSFDVADDEQTASVTVRETWTTTYRRANDGRCTSRVPTHVIPQTAHLRQIEGVWKVESISFEQDDTRAVSC